MAAPIQRSFAGGEIAPALYARTDQAKYATGARTLRNFLVRRHGGVTFRPGWQYIASAKNSAVAARLHRFVRDSTKIADTYLLELGEGYLRFYQNAGAVVVSGVAAWVNGTAYTAGDLASQGGVTYYCTTAHTAATGTNKPGVDAGWQGVWSALTGTIYEIPTPYHTADLPDMQFAQSGDVITITHPSYQQRELKRYAHTRWTITPVVVGPSIGQVANLAAAGGTAGTGYWAVTAVDRVTGEEGLPVFLSAVGKLPTSSAPTTLTWDPLGGAVRYYYYRSVDGATYGRVSVAGGVPTAKSTTTWVTNTSTVSGVSAGAWLGAGTQARINVVTVVADKAYDGSYTLKANLSVTGAGAGTGDVTQARVRVYYSRDGEPRVDAGVLADQYVSINAASTVTRAITGSLLVPDNGYATLTLDFVPEVNGTSASSVSATLDVTIAPNNSVAWQVTKTGAVDTGAAPDYGSAPPTQRSLFAALGDYPAAVGLYQQRRIFANSTNNPETVWGSRTAVFKSFPVSTPIRADDAVVFTLSGNETNVVKHLLDLARLVLFGSNAVHVLDGDQAGTLKPDAVNPREIARQGIGRLRPLKVGDSAVYVQARGSIVRDLQPVQSGGAISGYQGTDLTVFAAHLFDGFTIVDLAFAETPHSILWFVRSDGKLLGLTYLREQAIWGWHWHETDGAVENVCVVPEGTEDAVYLLVRRTVNGATKRTIERMKSPVIPDQPSAFFVDAGLTYNGWSSGTTTLTLSGGVAWDATEQLTLTASVNTFAAGDVGNAYHLRGADGSLVRCAVEAYTDAQHVKVRADRLVPVGMRGVAIGNGTSFVIGAVGYLGQWAKAVKSVSGLDHLEAKAVSVYADGFVVASPNNPAYPVLTVASGAITLPQPFAIITAGLPYVGDVVPQEVDAVGTTIKDRQQMNPKAILFVQDARGIWVGRPDKPTAAKPLNGLQEYKPRKDEGYDQPPSLHTERIEVAFDGQWDKSGKYGPFLVRQVDPIPCTILSIAPVGYGTQS